jgi:MFS family permease
MSKFAALNPAAQADASAQSASPPAASEPAAPRVGLGFVAVYALAYTGTWLALLTPVLVTIAMRVRELAPADPAESVSWVLALGAIFALMGNPLFGRLSDRTTSRFGMRRPWLVGGMLCGSLALFMTATAQSVTVVLIGWCLAQLAFNAVLAAIVALLPDQVPLAQRGAVAGVLGICLPLGQLAGTFVVHAVSGLHLEHHATLYAFMLPAAIGTAAVLLLAFKLRDRRLAASQVPRFDLRELARAYWVNPRRHRDFAWAWLSRFMLVLGTAFLTTYQTFYLTEKLGFGTSDLPTLVFKGMLAQASAIVLLSLLGGQLSDAIGRRKVFVICGATVYAIGLWIIASATSYSTFLVGMATTGVGHGLYFAVDLALVTDVLPDRQRDAAKDLGILNVANALPQSVAPAIAPFILALGGGDYLWLYFTAGCIALLGSFAILPVRSVR